MLEQVCLYLLYKQRYSNSSREIPEFPISDELMRDILMVRASPVSLPLPRRTRHYLSNMGGRVSRVSALVASRPPTSSRYNKAPSNTRTVPFCSRIKATRHASAAAGAMLASRGGYPHPQGVVACSRGGTIKIYYKRLGFR